MKKCQNWTKNDQVMPSFMFLCQRDIWPMLCQLMAILAKLLDMDFKFVLPSINISFFWILGSNFFRGLNQKSAIISMCKIHIYIDYERF